MKKIIFLIKSKESAVCPICEGHLSGYDSKNRHVIKSDGSKETYRLRRLKCKHCQKLHTELPDFMQPYKHYSTEVIEAELDETGIHCPADESTIRVWHKQFTDNMTQIEGALRSIWTEAHNKLYPLLSTDSLLKVIQNKGSGWLTTVTQMLLAAGLGIPTQFAFCP